MVSGDRAKKGEGTGHWGGLHVPNTAERAMDPTPNAKPCQTKPPFPKLDLFHGLNFCGPRLARSTPYNRMMKRALKPLLECTLAALTSRTTTSPPHALRLRWPGVQTDLASCSYARGYAAQGYDDSNKSSWNETPGKVLKPEIKASAEAQRQKNRRKLIQREAMVKRNRRIHATGGQPSAMLAVIDDVYDDMDVVDVATAFQRVAKRCGTALMRKQDGSQTWSRLSERLSALGAHAFSRQKRGHNAIYVLWAHAKVEMRVPDRTSAFEMLRELNSSMESHLDEFEPTRLAVLLWCWAKIQDSCVDGLQGVPPDDVRARAAKLVLCHVEALGPRDICNLLWSCAKSKVPLDDQAFEHIQKWLKLFQVTDALTSQDASVLLWSFADLQHQPDTDVLQLLERSLVDDISRALPKTISNGMWALAKFDHTLDDTSLLQIDAYVAEDRPWRSQDIGQLLWAWAKLGHSPSQSAMSAIDRRVRHLMDHFNEKDLANTMYAWARLGHTPETSDIASAERRATMLFDNMSMQELTNVMYGLESQVSRHMPQHALLSRVAGRIHESTDQQLIHLLRNFYAMSYDMGHGAMNRVRDRITSMEGDSERGPKFYANLLWLFASMRYHPGAEAMDSMSRTCANFSHMLIPRHVGATLFAWNKLGYVPDLDVWDRFCAGMSSTLLTKEWSARQLTYALWALGNMRPWRKPRAEHIAQIVALLDQSDVRGTILSSNGLLRQLYQANSLMRLGDDDGEAPLLVLPEDLLVRGHEEWLKGGDEYRSYGQHEVSAALARAGISNEQEILIPETPFKVDIWLDGARMAVEVEGPTHYTRTSPTVDPSATHMTLARRIWMHACGVRCLYVPYFAWATNDEAAQDRYVTEELLPRIEQRNGWTPEQLAVV